MSDLLPRAASAVVMIAAALITLSKGGDLFVLFWLIVALAVHWEWQRMIGAKSQRLRFSIGAVSITLSVVLLRQTAVEASLAALLAGSALLAWLAGQGRRIWAAAGLFYAALLVIAVTLLRVLSLLDGRESILWLFAVVWGTDIMAYFGGRLIGGPKLWPRVSPSKTWSGFLVGISCGAMLAYLTLAFFGEGEFGPPWALLLLGLLAGMVAQAGDLFESSVKRRFDVKDSSNLIPGHGGFMDRLDGFITAAAFAAIVGWIKAAGPGFIAIGLLQW
jgi:phosphatidate cytidylyltransferase